MKRILVASLAAGVLSVSAAATVAVQQPPPTPANPQTPARETTLVGCMVQGSSADVFLFENAVDPDKKEARPRTFKVTRLVKSSISSRI